MDHFNKRTAPYRLISFYFGNAVLMSIMLPGLFVISNTTVAAQPEENCLNFAEGQPRAECWRRKAFRQGASLARAYLVGTDFSGTSVLAGRQLTGANLSRANLRSARLSGAQMTGANLSYADLSGADLIGADLTNANFAGANVNGAVVSRQNRSGMSITKGVNFEDWKSRGGKVVNDIETPPPTTNVPQSGNRTVTNFIGMQFVEIPRGTFTMGEANRARFSNTDRAGTRQVTIGYGFMIGKFEVTQSQWYLVMGETQEGLVSRARAWNEVDPRELALGKNGALIKSWGSGDNFPVHWVTWNDAVRFVQKLRTMDREYDYRLPSQSEWEYAARSGTQSTTPFGDTVSANQANCFERGNQRFLDLTLKPVGSYQPNSWGIYDVLGNVSEWVQDAPIAEEKREVPPTDGGAFNTGENARLGIRNSVGGWFGVECKGLHSNFTYTWGQEEVYFGMGLRVVAFPRRVPQSSTPVVQPAPAVPQKLNAPMRSYPKENQEIKFQGVRRSVAIRFGWQPVPGAIAYIIDVQELKGGRWVPHTRQRTTENTFWVQQFPLGGGRWRLTTLGPNNLEGNSTRWWSFKVDLAINPF